MYWAPLAKNIYNRQKNFITLETGTFQLNLSCMSDTWGKKHKTVEDKNHLCVEVKHESKKKEIKCYNITTLFLSTIYKMNEWD